jgi:hypothetical protein
MTKQHISYSELKIFTECPHKWKLQYIDGLAGFTGNIYTAFGTAIHSVCEQSALGQLPDDQFATHFDEVFLKELKGLDEKPANKLIVEMREQSREIFHKVFPALQELFPGYEVYSSEEGLMSQLRSLNSIDTSKVSLTSLSKLQTASITSLTGSLVLGVGMLNANLTR